jgi:hypothetical protein
VLVFLECAFDWFYRLWIFLPQAFRTGIQKLGEPRLVNINFWIKRQPDSKKYFQSDSYNLVFKVQNHMQYLFYWLLSAKKLLPCQQNNLCNPNCIPFTTALCFCYLIRFSTFSNLAPEITAWDHKELSWLQEDSFK